MKHITMRGHGIGKPDQDRLPHGRGSRAAMDGLFYVS